MVYYSQQNAIGGMHMLKMPMEEFIEEVKAEIGGYEELGEAKATEWEQRFLAWINNPKSKKKNVEEVKGKRIYVLEDESDLFQIADAYFAAVDAEQEEEYWAKWE